MQSKTGQNLLIRLLQLVILAVVVWQMSKVVSYYSDLRQSKATYSSIQEEVARQVDEADPAHTGSDDEHMLTPERNISAGAAASVYDMMKKKNDDTVGYIEIPRAEIAYPVVQGADNDEYLFQSFDNEYNIAGSIFVDANNASDLSDLNTIIYGHHMKDGSMFHNLSAFRRGEYEGEQIEIQIIGENGPERYRIYSVYNVPEEEPYRQIGFENDEEYRDFVRSTWEDSEVKFDADPMEAKKIITLSTCTPNQEDFRIAVHAALLP